MTDIKIKIVIAEHKNLFRKALSALLRTNLNLDIIAEASTGKELLDILKHKQAHIVLLDSSIKVVESMEVMQIITKRFPDVKVIVLSDQESTQVQSEFIEQGAASFLNKSCDDLTLFKAIEKVNSEGFFFDSSTSGSLLSSLIKEKNSPKLPVETLLNYRETEIIKKICDGKTNKQIATGLHLSASTIDFYRTKIYNKTKCNNVTGLLKYAIKNGIVVLP